MPHCKDENAMLQDGQMSLIYSVTTVVMGILLLLFALLAVGIVSYPAFLGMFFMAYGAFAFVWTKRSRRRVSNSE
jgi:hypothetical protein